MEWPIGHPIGKCAPDCPHAARRGDQDDYRYNPNARPRRDQPNRDGDGDYPYESVSYARSRHIRPIAHRSIAPASSNQQVGFVSNVNEYPSASASSPYRPAYSGGRGSLFEGDERDDGWAYVRESPRHNYRSLPPDSFKTSSSKSASQSNSSGSQASWVSISSSVERDMIEEQKSYWAKEFDPPPSEKDTGLDFEPGERVVLQGLFDAGWESKRVPEGYFHGRHSERECRKEIRALNRPFFDYLKRVKCIGDVRE